MAAERVEWVDVTKFLAIVLVVLHHATVVGVPTELVNPVWLQISAVLASFRMPVFFFASGLFALSVIDRPWRRLWTSRLALLVWCFLLWSLLRYAYFAAVPMATRPWETDPLALLLAPAWPTSGLWFLHALVAFFVLAKILRGVPVWVQLALAATLSALSFSVLSIPNLSYAGMARYFVFFLAGAYVRDLALRVNEKARPAWTAGAIGAFVLATLLVHQLGIAAIPGVGTLLACVAVAAGCLLGRVLAAARASGGLAFIGRNTLPIYVQHVILVAAIYTVIDRFADAPPAWLGMTLPLLVTSLAIAVSLVFWAATHRLPVLRYLFAAPSWFSGERVAAGRKAS